MVRGCALQTSAKSAAAAEHVRALLPGLPPSLTRLTLRECGRSLPCLAALSAAFTRLTRLTQVACRGLVGAGAGAAWAAAGGCNSSSSGRSGGGSMLAGLRELTLSGYVALHAFVLPGIPMQVGEAPA